MNSEDINIRPYAAGDSLVELTELLHRAYAELGRMGLNYTAVDQSVEHTARRISSGRCALAHYKELSVGTMTVRPPDLHSRCEWFRLPHVASAHQFAVEPSLQGRGIGSMLLAWAEQWALASGFRELAVDTAEPAARLISFYSRRNYRLVGHVQWPSKHYRSVVLSKELPPESAHSQRRPDC